jgi:hypothetical protein
MTNVGVDKVATFNRLFSVNRGVRLYEVSHGTDHFKLDCAAVASRSCFSRHDDQA